MGLTSVVAAGLVATIVIAQATHSFRTMRSLSDPIVPTTNNIHTVPIRFDSIPVWEIVVETFVPVEDDSQAIFEFVRNASNLSAVILDEYGINVREDTSTIVLHMYIPRERMSCLKVMTEVYAQLVLKNRTEVNSTSVNCKNDLKFKETTDSF